MKKGITAIFGLFMGCVFAAEAGAAVSFSKLDRNDDDIISKSEWLWTDASFNGKDKNDDGVLSKSEYERKNYRSYNRNYRSNYPTTYQNYVPAQSYNTGYNYPVYNQPTYSYPVNNYAPNYGYRYPVNAYQGYGGSPYTTIGYPSSNGTSGLMKAGAAINLVGGLVNSMMAFR